MKLSHQLFGEGAGWRNRSILWAPWDIAFAVVAMPLILAWTLITLPYDLAREVRDRRQYERRRVLDMAYIAGWKAGKGIDS